MLCRAGEGVPQDYAMAADWFGRAAGQRLVPAEHSFAVSYNTGVVYERGIAVQQDAAAAGHGR